MEILIITGPPYSGKGTQCELLKESLGYKHISTGDRIRTEKETRSPIGKEMAAYEEKGVLVPDRTMRDLLEQVLDENTNEKGIILDGYPRTRVQVSDLTKLLEEKKLNVDLVINVNVPYEELLARAKKRAESSGRKDDQQVDTHLKRIRIFEEETKPAIEYMKSKFKVVNIDGLGTIESITTTIREVILAHQRKQRE